MGEAELNKESQQIIIHSIFYFYGDAASNELSIQIAEDISNHWNEPAGNVKIKGDWYTVRFNIEGHHEPSLQPDMVWYNLDPRNNNFQAIMFLRSMECDVIPDISSSTIFLIIRLPQPTNMGIPWGWITRKSWI